jgi:hypothetical protein
VAFSEALYKVPARGTGMVGVIEKGGAGGKMRPGPASLSKEGGATAAGAEGEGMKEGEGEGRA